MVGFRISWLSSRWKTPPEGVFEMQSLYNCLKKGVMWTLEERFTKSKLKRDVYVALPQSFLLEFSSMQMEAKPPHECKRCKAWPSPAELYLSRLFCSTEPFLILEAEEETSEEEILSIRR
jgi:hypothetical protein